MNLIEWVDFRLNHPTLGGLRCGVCEMWGGLVVRGELAEAVRRLPDASGMEIPEGSRVALPVCVHANASDAAPWKRAGRSCPFVSLDQDNVPAWRVVESALYDHTRPFAALYAESVRDDMPAEDGAQFLDRVSEALKADAVMKRLYPPPPEETDGRH